MTKFTWFIINIKEIISKIQKIEYKFFESLKMRKNVRIHQQNRVESQKIKL